MVTLNRWLLRIARNAPRLAQILAGPCLRAIWGKGDQVIPEQVEARLSKSDQLTLTRPELRQGLIASAQEAFRSGVRAPAWDGFLYAQPWGFRLEEIRVPVHVWHGEHDVIVPPAMGRHLAASIPNCRATFYPQDGHFSLPYNRLHEILSAARP